MSNVIAILALLVAILSALYARWAWREAKRANQISLLGHKKEIWDAFFELKMHMVQKAELAELDVVSRFYYPSRNAKIYLPTGLGKDVEEYYEACFWIANIHWKYGGMSYASSGECKQWLDAEKKLAPKIEKELVGLLKEEQS